MTDRRTALRRLAGLALASCGGMAPVAAADKVTKKILVEVFTSQGCDSCPPAADLMGKYKQFGYGPDRVVPLAFHVDYFNKPWKDALSDAKWSERQASYCLTLERRELYYTPLLLVDGRHDALANDGAKVEAAFKKGLAEAPTAALSLGFARGELPGPKRELQVTHRALGAALDGKKLLLGIAVFQKEVTTKVESGENKGKTLVEHNAVRSFAIHDVTPTRKARVETISVVIQDEWVAANCGVAAFLQDEKSGRVYQAEAIAWTDKARR